MAIALIEKLRIPLSLLFAIALGVFILLSKSGWEGTIFAWLLFALGCFLVSVASLGRLWCSVYIAGYKTDVLITEGPYSFCRHPLYFFSFIGGMGVGFATETLLIPSIIFLGFAIYYPFTMRSEDTVLLQKHGDVYKVYKEVTPAFFPKLSLLREPEKYTVNTRIFRRHILDALWFMWLVGIMEIIEGLHELDILAYMFKIR